MVKISVGAMGRNPMGVTPNFDFAQFLRVCKKHNVRAIDTARVYPQNEELLTRAIKANGWEKDFDISTKVMIQGEGSHKREAILASAKASLEALQLSADQRPAPIDIYYLHMPDRSTPFEETCAAVDELYQQGWFKRFGLSNYSAEEVEKIHKICTEKGYVRPSAHTCNYNPLVRTAEFELFPLLRRLGIACQSFGPLASGVLVKPIDDLVGPVKANSRMEALPFIQGLYLNDDIVKAVRHLETTCQKLGISKQNATLRYMLHHSGLSEDDSIILGASSPEQLESNLAACEGGALDREALKAFETLWDQVKGRKPKYHT
ncbi:Aldo/keto reductase [Ceraceosorus guamensis]|uniref:Aldo/keto reductase n=1 Tax=Ceraceosorus guamensis TaxID=1522189 RepID=A0A316W7V4_9BASI|nr:Aldo/keto reductase [Ceraceosorus guamensis]PWN45902.1 Aldo/keto reductase [Ceraceosorus guamensis]